MKKALAAAALAALLVAVLLALRLKAPAVPAPSESASASLLPAAPEQSSAAPPTAAEARRHLDEKLARLEEQAAESKFNQSAIGNSIPGFKPEPGADDPGPGEQYIQRYDGRSGRLSPGARPGDAEVTTRIPSTGPAPTLFIWVPSLRVQAGAQVVLHARMLDETGAPVAPAAITAAVAPHGGTPGAAQPLQSALAGEFSLSLRAPPPGQYDYLVRATGAFRGEPFERTAGGAFMVHASGGHIDPGGVRVERRGTDLALTAPAQIDKAGTYWMYAELWGGAGGARPIAFARDRFERLPEGPRTLTIVFGGAVVRDSGLDGPYVVRNLRFQQVDAFPPQEQEPIAALPPTPAYKAIEFN